MKILAVDTATFSCGVALAEDDQIIFQSAHRSRETHSRRLMPMIDAALKTTGLGLDDMDGFAVTKGPGSFTGLRIGISTVKGLAAPERKPVAGISALDALAWPLFPSPLPACVLMDARKGEVYTCCYSNDGTSLEKTGDEKAMPPAEALQTIVAPFLFVGTGAVVYRDLIQQTLGENAVFPLPCYHTISPAMIAHLGMADLKNNAATDPETLAPTYLRQPDAVVNRRKSADNDKCQ